MPNYNPKQSEEFKAKQKPKAAGFEDVKLGKPLNTRLPIDIDAAVRQMPNRSDWMRRVLVEAYRREFGGS